MRTKWILNSKKKLPIMIALIVFSLQDSKSSLCSKI
ncbi:hypothetical protein Leryth_025737 [Lithospermum erythrorhizon]|nr:hypothetical protein Leryth_025737 [Lithospermum erythrorhizon]